MAQILNCGLTRQQLSILITLCEYGVDPNALAQVVNQLKIEANAQ